MHLPRPTSSRSSPLPRPSSRRSNPLSRPLAAAALAVSLAVAAFAALAACAAPSAEREPELLVGVAASLQPVAEAFAERFEAERGATVTLVVGSSGALAEQLRQGAPLDLILSADARRIADLDADGLLAPGSIRHPATGELVAVTNLHVADGDADDVASLLRGGRVRRIALANPDLAPYGEAARRYLQNAGLWETAEPLAVYGATVAQALQYAASGAAELGFVARSLLTAPGAAERGFVARPLRAAPDAAEPGFAARPLRAAPDAELGSVARPLSTASGESTDAAPDPLSDDSAANFPGLRALPPLPQAASDGLRVLPPLPREASAGLRVAIGVNATSPNAKRAGEFAAYLADPARADAWLRFGYAPE